MLRPVFTPYDKPPENEIQPVNFLDLRNRAPQFLILAFPY